MRMRAFTSLAVVVAATVSLLTACGSSSGNTSTPSSSSAAISVADAWVKATDGEMTAVFARITNPGSSEVVITAAKTTLSDMAELHEMVMKDGQMVMQPKPGGFPIAAGSTLTLEPGGNHIMVMGLTGAVKVGDEASVTITLSTGATATFTAIAKETGGGSESYNPPRSMSMSSSMSMD